MKNYYDEKYPDIYQDAQKEFYYQMVTYDHKKLVQEVRPYDKEKFAHNKKAYKKYILDK